MPDITPRQRDLLLMLADRWRITMARGLHTGAMMTACATATPPESLRPAMSSTRIGLRTLRELELRGLVRRLAEQDRRRWELSTAGERYVEATHP